MNGPWMQDVLPDDRCDASSESEGRASFQNERGQLRSRAISKTGPMSEPVTDRYLIR
jgi:hypothetical protein